MKLSKVVGNSGLGYYCKENSSARRRGPRIGEPALHMTIDSTPHLPASIRADRRFVRCAPPPGSSRSVADRLGRPLRDLRISVTDRCNFRCTYCMPKQIFGPEFVFMRRSDLLSFEEITRLVRVFVDHGIEKIRITGGEPLVRRNLERLVEQLAGIEGLNDITLTTNGALLPKQAHALRQAGLERVTVSLDSLDETVFRAMNDVGFPVSGVLDGIVAAESAGMHPIKINMVVKRGVNDRGITEMARYFRGSGHIVRFIEFMDVGTTNGWRLDDVVPAEEMVSRIDERWPLEPVAPNYPGEVASRYRYLDGAGEIGVIASVSQPFCRGCTRARISAEGKLYTCLFAADGHDFRALLRDGSTDEAVGMRLREIWHIRGDRYSEIRSDHTTGLRKVEMSHIGG